MLLVKPIFMHENQRNSSVIARNGQEKNTSVKDVIKSFDSMSDVLPPNLVSSVRHSHSFSSSSVFVAARTITLRHLIYRK